MKQLPSWWPSHSIQVATRIAADNKVIVALPAYNEEKYIGSAVLKARKYANTVIVVDDGSTDSTVEIAKMAGAVIVRHEHNSGYGATLQTILNTARRMNIVCLVIMDADYQHEPDDITAVAAPILSGQFDLVVGQREQKSIPKYRVLGQSVLSVFTRAVSGSKVRDTQSGFRAFSRKAIDMLELHQTGMVASSEMTAEAARLGLRVTEVPVQVRYDGDGSTHNPLNQGVHTLNKVLNMIAERKPLLFFGSGGIALLVAGVLVGAYSYNTLISTSVPPVGTMLVSTLCIMVGLLMTFTGILLHTIAARLGK